MLRSTTIALATLAVAVAGCTAHHQRPEETDAAPAPRPPVTDVGGILDAAALADGGRPDVGDAGTTRPIRDVGIDSSRPRRDGGTDAGCTTEVRPARGPGVPWGYCGTPCEALWYAGSAHTTSFELASVDGVTTAEWIAEGALDDHFEVPSPYCLRARLNGVELGELTTEPLAHGAPYAGPFRNMGTLRIALPVEALRPGRNELSLELDCARDAGDWIVVRSSVLELSRSCP